MTLARLKEIEGLNIARGNEIATIFGGNNRSCPFEGTNQIQAHL